MSLHTSSHSAINMTLTCEATKLPLWPSNTAHKSAVEPSMFTGDMMMRSSMYFFDSRIVEPIANKDLLTIVEHLDGR